VTTYFDGQWVEDEKATINVRSRALNYGLGCFGGIRGYLAEDGKQVHVFRLDAHVRRLALATKALFLRLPGDDRAVAAIIVELLRRNEARHDVYVRPIAFHNSTQLAPVLDEKSSSFTVYCLPLQRYLQKEAIDVCVSSWRRIPDNAMPTRFKPTGAYLNSALARREAMDNGFDEAILLTEAGKVSEGSAEHIFIARDGILYTPPSTEDNLDGITRRTLMALAREDLGYTVIERQIGRSELYFVDEMFLCGTGAEITAVRSVDRRAVGTGEIGPITARLRSYYESVCRGGVKKRREWLTPVWG
jgi:branched-chain amino acid aminotransferase